MDGGNQQDIYIHTLSDKKAHFLAPIMEEIDMHDLAVGLSNSCRYNGMVSSFYSTAQHSTIMSYWAEEVYDLKIAKAAMLHDAAEVWIGEIVTPVKKLFPDLEDIEGKIAAVIFEMHGLDPALFNCAEIKDLDQVMYQTELRDVKPMLDPSRPDLCIPKEFATINPQMPDVAFTNFKMRYKQLFGDDALPIFDYFTPV